VRLCGSCVASVDVLTRDVSARRHDLENIPELVRDLGRDLPDRGEALARPVAFFVCHLGDRTRAVTKAASAAVRAAPRAPIAS
jgi:hypothetical protein